MREIRQSGSVRGVRRNPYPYRDFHQGQRLFENIEGNHGLVFVDDQWRAEPERGFSAAQHHQAAFKGQGLNLVAQRRSRFAGGFVQHQLDTDHQAAPAHIADQRVSCLPAAQPF
jgi:hypothetical protein